MNRDIFRLDEISIRGLCMDVIRHMWMIILAAVSVWLAATAIHNLTYEPEYTAASTLAVSVKGETDAYASLSLTSQMADVFGQVFQSDALREKIVEDVGENIEGTISCVPVTETNLLVLSATCPDPRQAFLFINSALEHYEEVAGDVFANASLLIVQEPEVPSEPSNTSWFLAHRTLLTALGALGMAALICLLYVLRFTVKNERSASRQLDGRIRGVIPFEKKTAQGGKRKNPKQALLLNSPLVSMNFAEAMRSAEAKVEHHMRRHHQKVLLVTSVTENEGKSTVAANIALALGEKNRKVLLVDGDLKKPAQNKVFEEQEQGRHSLDEVLAGGVDWKEALFFSEKNNIWEMFQFHSVEDSASALDIPAVKTMLKGCKEEMDYIIIDCSPTAVSTDAEIWMGAADTVLLVIREDWADVRVINDTVDVIWQSGRDFTGFILNAFHREWFRAGGEDGYENYVRRSRGTDERS